jgi:hypothetical protein
VVIESEATPAVAAVVHVVVDLALPWWLGESGGGGGASGEGVVEG